MTPRERLLAKLRSSPPTERGFFFAGWDRAGEPDLWSELLTMTDWIAVLEDRAVTPTKLVRVTATAGLRRRAKPVTGDVLEVIPHNTTEIVYADASDDPVYVKGWLKVVRGGWLAEQYVVAA